MALIALVLMQTAGQLPELVLQPESLRPGGLLVITLTGVDGTHQLQGDLDGRPLRFFLDDAGNWQALVAVPLGRRPGQAALLVRITAADESQMVLGWPVEILDRVFEKQVLSVDPRYVRPPASERKRIREEKLALEKLWRAPATARKWRGSFIWPLKGEIASEFGLRRVFNGRLHSRHFGLDIDGPAGAPVKAIGHGTVVMTADRYYSGKTVIIDHGLRLFSLYFHLSEMRVSEGQQVRQGEVIGLVGSTGRSTGPHLHVSVKLDGVTFDPRALFQTDLSE